VGMIQCHDDHDEAAQGVEGSITAVFHARYT
jgi:hypothetical protein